MGTPVWAIAAGIVISVSTSAASGLTVLLDHRVGLTSTYSHLSKSFVGPGQTVAQGQEIALSGATGTSATGPHLHLGVRDLLAPGAPWVDPQPFAAPAPGFTVAPAPGGAFTVSGEGLTAGQISAGLAIVAAVLLLGRKD